jgi:hypothetical protein
MRSRDEYVKKYAESLPEDQRNPDAKQVFDRAIERASKTVQSESEKPEPRDGYTGRSGSPRNSAST